MTTDAVDYLEANDTTAAVNSTTAATANVIEPPRAAGVILKLSLILQFLQLYYMPILVIMGCVGNALSVIVFFGTKLRKLSSSYYLAALAISDCGFLVAQFITWLNMVNVSLFNKAGFCQMAIYFSHVCSFMSVWLVVLFTVERFIAVRYPLHRAAVCTVARAKLFIGCLTTIAITSYGPYLLIAAPQNIVAEIGNQTKSIEVCALVPEYIELASLLNHADFSLTLVVPFCIIVTLNTLICRTVTKLARVRRTMTLTNRKKQYIQQHRKHNNNNKESTAITNVSREPSTNSRRNVRQSKSRYGQSNKATSSATNNNSSSGNNASQTNVTQMLLVVSTVFICLNLPSYLLRILVYVDKKGEMTDTGDSVLVLLQHYANLLFATNFGINFILYCISGQNFRRSLCSLICSRRMRERKTRMKYQTQTTILSELSRGGIASSVHRRMTTTSTTLNGVSNVEMNELAVNTNVNDYSALLSS